MSASLSLLLEADMNWVAAQLDARICLLAERLRAGSALNRTELPAEKMPRGPPSMTFGFRIPSLVEPYHWEENKTHVDLRRRDGPL